MDSVDFNKCPHVGVFNSKLEGLKNITTIQLKAIHDKLDTILTQTEKTNGRVTAVEKFCWAIGGAVVLVGADKLISIVSTVLTSKA